MLFAKTIKRQGEKIIRLEDKLRKVEDANQELREENDELWAYKRKVKNLIAEADKKQENYFITFDKIKELDIGKTF